ncbi:hypothetical protein EBR21_07835, partial [bacterium]|nr:hypothetical protein [bacterium]
TQRQEEKTWDWNDQTISDEWRQQILSNILPETTAAAQSYCAPGVADGIRVEGPLLSGNVRLQQDLELPFNVQFAETNRPVPAKLFPGQPGLGGFNAGSISIFSLNPLDSQSIAGLVLQPGMGGAGGRHNKSPASQAIQEIRYETRKLREHLDLNQLKATWRVQFYCPSQERAINPLHTLSTNGIWLKKTVPVSTDLVLAEHQIKIPGLPEGTDLEQDNPTNAPQGKIGRSGNVRIHRIKSLEEMEAKVGMKILELKRRKN